MSNNIIKSILPVFLFSMAIILMNCKGDQGDPGPASTPGTNGTAGKDGAAGVNGVDGVAYDEAVSRGGFAVYLDGKRPDGVAFSDTLNFKFSSSAKSYSSIQRYVAFSDSTDDSYLKRYTTFNGVNNDASYAYLYSGWRVSVLGDTSRYIEIDFHTSIASEADHKYFDLTDSYYFESYFNNDGSGPYIDGSPVKNYGFSSYAYDSLSGSMQNGARFTVPANDNATGYDLKVQIVVDATVYQQIPGANCVECRRKEQKVAAASQRVEKAVMKSY